MNNFNFDEKLTDAAREALKELIEDYRNQVLLSAAENASRLTGEVREISVHDLLRGVRSAGAEPGSRESGVFDRLLNVYALVGIVTGMAGLGWFAVRDLSVGLDPQRQIPLLIGFAGLGIAALSFVMLRLRQVRGLVWPFSMHEMSLSTASSSALTGQFIARWQQIELALRSIVGSQLGESVANEPLSALVSRLRNESTLGEDDVIRLRRLLETRNAVVHKGLAAPESDLQASLREAERLLAKLRSQQGAATS